MKNHLKRAHEMDGVYEQFIRKQAQVCLSLFIEILYPQTPTQPYVKRNRGSSASLDADRVSPPRGHLAAVRAALASTHRQRAHIAIDETRQREFLALFPKSDEVINVSAGIDSAREHEEHGESGQCVTRDGDAQGSPSVSSTNNQLQAAAIAAVNPFMYMAAANALASRYHLGLRYNHD
jgi:hypothetical protein